MEKSGKPFVYLDSAAMAQMPQEVIDAMRVYDESTHANVHRGIYSLSEASTVCYESARGTVQKFINAASSKEIVFTRNTTESINLVAASFG